MKIKYLLIGTSLSLIPQYALAQCVETNCQKLGYDKLQKCDNGLKCPFGEYWACPEPKSTLGECTGYAKNCAIGQILNSDGTCTTDKVSSKTPIGVVVAIKDNCGYAMTANPIQKGIVWSSEYVNTGAFQSNDWQQAMKDFNVMGNMTAIIQTASKHGNNAASVYPAAYAAINYAPSTVPATKGKWVLPTAGILNSLYTNLSSVNRAISKLGGTRLIENDFYDEHIWSSSEATYEYAWFLCTDTGSSAGGGLSGSGKRYGGDGHAYVRPVIAF